MCKSKLYETGPEFGPDINFKMLGQNFMLLSIEERFRRFQCIPRAVEDTILTTAGPEWLGKNACKMSFFWVNMKLITSFKLNLKFNARMHDTIIIL